ncbi:TIGR03759 family integrating conjugative element protein [Pseudomonas protegens]|uniref:TIGR03759 family integrating conjugative element protein n=1 Tax=Pseudomonas protegens TaxID=380021 RepID=UPI0037F341F7
MLKRDTTPKSMVLLLAAIPLGLVLLGWSMLADADERATQQSNSLQGNSSFQQPQASSVGVAQEWGLTQQEYTRYQELMQGPRGSYSPGLDPLTTLGIEAKSPDERRRYAELQVQAERRRVDKELAYQRAYDEAFARLYPSEKVIQITSAANDRSKQALQPALGSGRLAVFVKDNCPACNMQVKEMQAQQQVFDLYFVGSQNDDEKIRNWAILAGIDPSRVRSRQITLNHDQGRWLGLGLGGDLPAVVREVHGQWQRQ